MCARRSTYEKKDDVALDPKLEEMLKSFFSKMDLDGDGSVTKEEAVKFWGKNFAKVSCAAPAPTGRASVRARRSCGQRVLLRAPGERDCDVQRGG